LQTLVGESEEDLRPRRLRRRSKVGERSIRLPKIDPKKVEPWLTDEVQAMHGLPETVKLQLAAHLTAYPAVEIGLPWGSTDGETIVEKLVLSTRERTALNRNYINTYVWKVALAKVGMEGSRENGMHALRHWYASVLLDAGESIRAVAEYLGHSDPGFTLRVYTHLMPTSAARTRAAIDAVLRLTPDDVDGHASGPDVAPIA
jgi:hypothetical protein